MIVRYFARANDGILGGEDPASDAMAAGNDFEMKSEVEERTLHRMAKVHNILEMWQGCQNLCATQKESHTQNKPMTAIGWISDTREIVNESWSHIQHDGAAAYKLLERSPVPPA